MTLRIQCPACQRQFKVSDELKGRTVECGACENQFVVDDHSVVPQRDRYFPGDIKKPGLDHYGRAPSAGSEQPVRFATATYDDHATAADVTPLSPQRMFAGALGVVIQILFAVILLFGSQEDGILKDMAHEKRIVLAAFVAVVGAALIIYGNFHRKKQAALTCVALAAVVLLLAVFLPVPKTIENLEGSNPNRIVPGPAVPDPASRKLTELEAREAMGYGPVAKAFQNFGYESVVALWAPTMKERFKYQVQRYLHREAGTAERPSYYNRKDGGLIVIEGTKLGLPEIEAVVERFARVDEVYPELRVLKISIEGARLLEPSPELERKLIDTEHPSFYALNQSELDHIDIDRVREAAQRLADVEPKRFRPEIAKRLMKLLQDSKDTEFQATICNAILVWSEPGDGAEQAVARVAKNLLATEAQVPRSMIGFLLARKAPEVVPLLEALWKKEPSTWEPILVDVGKDAESTVAPYLRSKDRSLKRSAIIILRRVGTSASLPALRKALQGDEDEEMRALLRTAIESIQGQ